MQGEFYKLKLYPLQDKVLDLISASNTPFYLTGGTALSRFYLNHRYSDDLDFFVNSVGDFKEYVALVTDCVKKEYDVRISIYDTDFARIYVSTDQTELKVEFINDVAFHFGEFVFHGDLRIDNPLNILSNKLTALTRDAEKDFADILFLSWNYSFHWIDIFNAAKEKDAWVNEISAAAALHNFDITRLKSVGWIHDFDYQSNSTCFHTIAKDILMGADNSLYK